MKAHIYMDFNGIINGVSFNDKETYWGVVNILSAISTAKLGLDTDDNELTRRIAHKVGIIYSMKDDDCINKWFRKVERLIKDSPKADARRFILDEFKEWEWE